MAFLGKEFDLVAVRIASDFLTCYICFFFLISSEANWKIMCYILLIMIDVNCQICVMGLAHCILFLLSCGCAKLVIESVMRL